MICALSGHAFVSFMPSRRSAGARREASRRADTADICAHVALLLGDEAVDVRASWLIMPASIRRSSRPVRRDGGKERWRFFLSFSSAAARALRTGPDERISLNVSLHRPDAFAPSRFADCLPRVIDAAAASSMMPSIFALARFIARRRFADDTMSP